MSQNEISETRLIQEIRDVEAIRAGRDLTSEETELLVDLYTQLEAVQE